MTGQRAVLALPVQLRGCSCGLHPLRRRWRVVVDAVHEHTGQGTDVLDRISQGDQAAVVGLVLSHRRLPQQAFQLNIKSERECTKS